MTNQDINNRKNRRGRMADGQPNPIDAHIGDRIRQRRILLGLSQEKLAVMLGLTFQQIQKYERGINRVSGSRLWDLSQILAVPVNFFYEDMDKQIQDLSPRFLSPLTPENAKQSAPTITDPMSQSQNIELVSNLNRIHNPKARQHIHALIRELAKGVYFND